MRGVVCGGKTMKIDDRRPDWHIVVRRRCPLKFVFPRGHAQPKRATSTSRRRALSPCGLFKRSSLQNSSWRPRLRSLDAHHQALPSKSSSSQRLLIDARRTGRTSLALARTACPFI